MRKFLSMDTCNAYIDTNFYSSRYMARFLHVSLLAAADAYHSLFGHVFDQEALLCGAAQQLTALIPGKTGLVVSGITQLVFLLLLGLAVVVLHLLTCNTCILLREYFK